jgi:hypothetical protein
VLNDRYALLQQVRVDMFATATRSLSSMIINEHVIDVVKVRLQADIRSTLTGGVARYHGTWHAFRQIINEEGVSALYRGKSFMRHTHSLDVACSAGMC